MASVSEFRTGMAIRHNNDIWMVTEFQHVTPGNWRAMLRTKLKNVKTGRVMDVTFRMTDKIEEVRLIEKKMQYLYSDEALHFMDTETYDQTYIAPEMLAEGRQFLKEGDMVSIYFLEGSPMLAEMPNFAELEITEAEPAVRGDSATNIMKYAIVQTGAKVQVPLFIKVGDVIKIDTRTGRYIERVTNG